MSLMFDHTYGHVYWVEDKIGPPEYWFRYVDVLTTDGPRVDLIKFPVLKHTETGAWIKDSTGKKRFCWRECRKRYASPTLEIAKTSFIARKKKQAAIYRARADHAEEAIRIIKAGKYGFSLW